MFHRPSLSFSSSTGTPIPRDTRREDSPPRFCSLFAIHSPLGCYTLHPSLTFAVGIAFAIRLNDANSLTLEKPIGTRANTMRRTSFFSFLGGDASRTNVRGECQSPRSYNEQLISRPLDTPLDTDRTTNREARVIETTKRGRASFRFDIVSALRTRGQKSTRIVVVFKTFQRHRRISDRERTKERTNERQCIPHDPFESYCRSCR